MANNSSLKVSLRRSHLKWHNTLLWWGAACVLIWTLSGLTHPMMSWFGPKQANYRPPALTLDVVSDSNLYQGITPTALKTMTTVLDDAHLAGVSIAKVVPSADGPMLQLTYDQQKPRQYVPLMALMAPPNATAFGLLPAALTTDAVVRDAILEGYDESQARWLASYYTGRPQDEIEQVTFQTEFDGDYPWVNRLLPVYRIRFDGKSDADGVGDDPLTAYIHTESLQLAGLANQNRLALQTIFRAFHTFDFLDEQDNVRVTVLFLAMLLLIGVSVSGLGLVILIKTRKIKQTGRRWHRRIAYVIWLPLFAWSISGGYHLIQAAYVDAPAGIKLNPVFDFGRFAEAASLVEVGNSDVSKTLNELSGKSILSASLMNLEGQLVYRLSVANRPDNEPADPQAHSNEAEGPHSHHQQLVKKYQGNPSEKTSVYVDAFSLSEVAVSDKERAVSLAVQFAGLPEDSVTSVEKVSHFGPDYDFRNKRLPVWKVSFDDEDQMQLFVDPATNVLVDQTRSVDRAERWSFSVLHKWNHLIPFTGRFKRDVIIVITLAFLTLITVFGIRMALVRRESARRTLRRKNRAEEGLSEDDVSDLGNASS
ncbi:hypothetical protein [Litoribrevibacter albus]|uniref:PepSY domain-containing protein n=1 Tax=Litoribrevibacter albus TaxID=1473156 RepID=A0AA37W7E5_9GAMM|nr:hypothetical protein [Litoribrevibacter albus]GLQ30356.1 hypothetical protein GCM10007876_08340 [Litoribrevibacter albus]